MSAPLSLARAARLVGVPRSALQRKIANGELASFDGLVSLEELRRNFPDAEFEPLAPYLGMQRRGQASAFIGGVFRKAAEL